MTHQRLHIDVNPEDREWMKQHLEDIDHFVALVLEIVEKEPKLLLSPIFRSMIVENAHKVKDQRSMLVARELFLDNPGKPITER